MFSSDAPSSSAEHVPLVAALAADLAAAQYTNAAIEELLGAVPAAALAEDDPTPAKVLLETTKATPSTLVRLWLLGEQVTATELDDVLPQVGVRGLQELSLVEEAQPGLLRALFDLRPYSVDEHNYWVCSDLGAMVVEGPLRPDYVLGIGQASLTLAHATVRPKVAKALDVGTGCGVQALHLLSHCEQVTVTDISSRALAFARFNFLLNKQLCGLDDQLSRVRFLKGSLLEPVAGEKFDLIVSNPPFVITPRNQRTSLQKRYEYRDGGQQGDTIVAQLVQKLPEHLVPGGYAQMLANWEILQGQQLWYGRIQTWHNPQSNIWVVQRDIQTGEEYARMWLKDASESSEVALYEQAWRDYAADFADRNVAEVGFGLVYLSKPTPGQLPWQWWEELTNPIQPPLGLPIGESITKIAQLKLSGDLNVWSETETSRIGQLSLIPAEAVTYEQHRRLGAEEPEVIMLRQGTGFGRTQALSSAAAGVISACDGSFTVAELAAGYQSLLPEEAQENFDLQALLSEIGRLYLSGYMKQH